MPGGPAHRFGGPGPVLAKRLYQKGWRLSWIVNTHGHADHTTGNHLWAAGGTDLPGGSLSQLIASLEEKIMPLPDDTRVWPGHDYGETPHLHPGPGKTAQPYLTDFF
jgi:glyoxylase-like metal-dependent hydrolase (beta-lactamase superfamily II)